jgi:hypothetical protein
MAQEGGRAANLAICGQAKSLFRTAFGLHLGHFDLFLLKRKLVPRSIQRFQRKSNKPAGHALIFQARTRY